MPSYRVLIGLNYPDGSGGEKRAEPGSVVTDLPEKAAKAFLRDGAIEPSTTRRKPKTDDEEGGS